MLRFLLALVALAVLTPDSQACPQQRRGGFFARVVAAERALVRAPLHVATAPFRMLSGRAGYRERTTVRTSTRLTVPCVPTVVVPVPVPVPMPPKK